MEGDGVRGEARKADFIVRSLKKRKTNKTNLNANQKPVGSFPYSSVPLCWHY